MKGRVIRLNLNNQGREALWNTIFDLEEGKRPCGLYWEAGERTSKCPPAHLGKDRMISKGMAPSGLSGKFSFPVHSSRIFGSYLLDVSVFKNSFILVLQQRAEICSGVMEWCPSLKELILRDTGSSPQLLRSLQGDEVSRCPPRAEHKGKRYGVEVGTSWSLAKIPKMRKPYFLTIFQSVTGCHLFGCGIHCQGSFHAFQGSANILRYAGSWVLDSQQYLHIQWVPWKAARRSQRPTLLVCIEQCAWKQP